MVSQRSRVRDFDLYNQASEKFLSLIPASSVLHNSNCGSSLPTSQSTPPFTSGFHSLQNLPPLSRGGSLRLKRHQRSPSTSSFAFGDLEKYNSIPKSNTEWYVNNGESELSSYMDYLIAAHKNVKACTLACQCWCAVYDGLDPPPSALNSSCQNKDSEFSQNFVQNDQFSGDFSNEQKNASHIQKSRESDCSTVLELSSENLAAHQDSLQETHLDKSSCIEKNFVIKSLYRPKDVAANNDILNQIINADDERTFWNLVCSTNTPNSVDNLDDSLETIDGYLNDFEESDSRPDSKPPLFSDNVDIKDECSNADSGVFESRESCVSEKDSDIIMMSAKSDENKDSLFITIPPKTDLKSRSSVSETSTKSSNSPASPSTWESFGTPNIGPFLSILLTRLEMMMQNDVYTNLHLTGLISRLACYPQPLLKSFLLNPSLVFQPTVRSLFQVTSFFFFNAIILHFWKFCSIALIIFLSTWK